MISGSTISYIRASLFPEVWYIHNNEYKRLEQSSNKKQGLGVGQKITLRYYFISTRMAKIKNTIITSVDKDMDKLEIFIHYW